METGIHNTSEIGRLRRVLLHRPGGELENLMPEYLERLLFDDIPYLKEAQREHDAFADCLRQQGVEVVYLADLVAEQVQEYHKHGFQVLGIVGANRSPNCGVETTSDFDREVEGRGAFMEAIAQRLEAAGIRGAFMEAIAQRLEAAGISVPMLGLKGSDDAAQKVAALL